MLRRSPVLGRVFVSNYLKEPSERKTFAETLAFCKANGVDMASGLTSDFLLLQSRLFKYRIARLGTEVQFICAHPFSSLPPVWMWPVHAVALPAAFYGAWWAGRLSISELTPPPALPAPPAPAA